MEYKIIPVNRWSSADFELCMQHHIADGWRICGGTVHVYNEHYQQLTRSLRMRLLAFLKGLVCDRPMSTRPRKASAAKVNA